MTHRPVLSALSPESLGIPLKTIVNSGQFSSASWPLANRAVFVPFALESPYLVRQLWWANGSSVLGNRDCGIYSADATLLVSTGSTVQAGTSTIQAVTLGTPFLLDAGSYYMALSASSTGTAQRTQPAILLQSALGIAIMDSAFPLPAAATLAVPTTTFLPLFGLCTAAVI